MNVAFLTETGYQGKWPLNFPNARTEIAWQITLNADHYNIHNYNNVKGYDVVFVIFPKSTVKLNSIGIEMNGVADRDMAIYTSPIIEVLKEHNKKVCNIQEGPSWFFNDYNLDIQFHFYNKLSECDILFAHNYSDVRFYSGLFRSKRVDVIPTLMISPDFACPSHKQNKAIIEGNFARWYGGFQSYIVASTFDCPIYVPSSHCKRNGEEQVPNLHHLPWVNWNQWMLQLSEFKYAVNIMPTVAAGTFSMNCAYWGIPCIGNVNVDTQNTLFPRYSVGDYDIDTAQRMADALLDDAEYKSVSEYAQETLRDSYHLDRRLWLEHMEKIING